MSKPIGTDDLVKRARKWNFCWPSHDVEMLVPAMADRIEQLAATNEELEAKLRVITERSNEVELANVELGEKLAKAVEFAEVVVRCGYGALWDLARTTLAELKGQDDE